MSTKYPGGFISSTEPTVSPLSAKGVWTLAEALRYKAANEWPVTPIYVGVQGVFATANVGQAESVIPVLLTGLQATGSVNDLTVIGSAIVALDAVTGTGGVGAVSISLPTVNDPYFNLNSMLLADSLANTFITDEGPNKFVITPNGDTRPSAFSPYNGEWCNYFDGSGDYLQAAYNSAFDLGSSDFTIEAFVKTADSSSNYPSIIGRWQGSGTACWDFRPRSTDVGNFFCFVYSTNGSNAVQVNSNTVITDDAWHHLVAVRSGNDFALFVDGVRKATANFSGVTIFNSTSAPLYVGYDPFGSTYYTGYTSNVRLVKGTAVYNPTSASLVVPTEPLTAVFGTQLLTCQSNGIIDQSPNNFTITKNGDVKPISFGPFATDYRQDPVSHSVYFDGSGDYLTTTSLSAFSGDFTIECWIYPMWTPSNAYRLIFSINSSLTGPLVWGTYGTGASGLPYLTVLTNGTGEGSMNLASPNDVIRMYEWQHIALVRSNGVMRQYHNGEPLGFSTNSNTFTPTTFSIGSAGAARYFQGYMSNFSIKHGVADYTSAFTPPTSPLTAVTNTSLLTCQSPTIVDNSSNAFTITANGNSQPSSVNPFDGRPTTYSGYFDGSGDYLSVANDAAFALGTNDFTIEFFVYPTNVSSTQTIFAKSNGGFGPFLFQNASGAGRIYISSAGSSWNLASAVSTGSIPINTWTHIALTRSGSTFTTYNNGTQVATFESTASIYNPTNAITVGYNGGSYPEYFYGYVSNVRFVNGTAITPPSGGPTEPLTAVTNTQLLTCQSPAFIDNSTNAFAITVNGNSTVSTNNPLGYVPITNTAITDTTGSGYFDGNGDTLTGPADSTTMAFGTGDFTVEGWFYQTNDNTYPVAFEIGNHINSTGIVFITRNSGSAKIYSGSFKGGKATTLNEWNHIAWVRKSGVLTVYVNGVGDGGTAFTNNLTDDSWTIIGTTQVTTPTTYNYTGYISNLRVIKGTALYAANFVPPSTPLTSVTNTSLLTLQNRVSYNNSQPIDESGIKNVITRNGNASVGSYSPYVPSGWSGYFDGSDYLGVTGFPAFGTGDFTVEWWGYKNDTYNDAYDITDGGNGAFAIYSSTSGTLLVTRQSVSGAAKNLGSLSSLNPNQWYYFAIIRESGNVRCYVDGQPLAAAVADTNSYAGATKLFGTADGYWPGYISNFRVFTSAIYAITSSSIPVPTEPFAPQTSSGVSASLLLLRSPTFNDESPSRLAITRFNDSKITPFSPFLPQTGAPDSYSVYFDGSGDSLQSPSASSVSGTENFTIEFWLYSPSFGSSYKVLLANDTGSGFSSGLNANGTIFYGRSLITVDGTTTATLNFNSWNHIAYVRSGTGTNQFSVYINGVGQQFTNSTSYASGVVRIGTDGGGSSFPYLGYISNVRIVKGTAVYTSNFTPPTEPLTAISDTSLLTCQSPTAIDNSTNDFSITVNGNSQPTKFNPFGETVTTDVEYTPAAHGGSVYLDGTDYLATTAQPLVGDFEISFWYYSLASGTYLLGTGNVSGSWAFLIDGSFRINNLASNYITATGYTPYSWNHVCVSRSNGTIRLFYNGVFQGSQSNTGTFSQTALGIGSFGQTTTYASKFYISNFRIINGPPTYTSSFVPPQAPLDPIPSTTLLTCGNNAAIYDYVGRNVLETVGNARTVQETPYRANHSVYFDGSGDYLSVPSDTAFVFDTGDFTTEAWIYPTTVSGSELVVLKMYGSVNAIVEMRQVNNTMQMWFRSTSGATSTLTSSAGSIVTDQWQHIAFVRQSGTLRAYINGVQYTTATNANTQTDTSLTNRIGANQNGTGNFNGYISNIRILKGVCAYPDGTTFDPPTEPLTAVSGTSLLTCNTYNFTDSSTNNFTITRNGDAKISSRGPFQQNEGDRSLYFDGTGDFLTISDNPVLAFGSGDFTLEMWLYSVGGDQGNIYDGRPNSSTNGAYPSLLLYASTLRWYISSGDRIISSTIPINQWFHVVVQRSSGTTKMFIDGTQTGSDYTDTTNYLGPGTGAVHIASDGNTSAAICYIDDLRITKGYARYNTAGFNPPSEPLPKV